MESKIFEYKLIKFFFVLGFFFVKILKAFVNIRTLLFVFYEVFSVFNEFDILSGLVVGISVGVVLRRGVVFIIFWEFGVYFVNWNFFFERRL